MSSRIFQNVIAHMQEATSRAIGVASPDGVIVASSDLSLIGLGMGDIASLIEKSESFTVINNGNTFKALGQGSIEDYVVFVSGDDDLARTVCIMAAIAINEAGIYFEENHDKRAFVKNIISENIMPGDIYVRAKELNLIPDTARGVLVVRLNVSSVLPAIDIIQDLLPDKQSDYVISVDDTDIAVIKEMPQNSDTDYLMSLAKTLQDSIEAQLSQTATIGIGSPAYHLRELADKYKQALTAIDIGRVFEIGGTIISYENLGISRLIYQLPTTLCEIFLSEVFKRNPIEALDAETILTIDTFFENSLNVSETSRKLYIHRNTLVYRLDKIKRITGLDLRELEHAIVFKVAQMVKLYLNSQEPKFL